jgi:hypothetical protein
MASDATAKRAIPNRAGKRACNTEVGLLAVSSGLSDPGFDEKADGHISVQIWPK